VIDLLSSMILVILLAIGALAWLSVGRAARPSYARVDRVVEGVLLGRGAATAGYWALQPIARGFARAGVSADAVTMASLPLAATSGVAFATGHYGGGALFAALAFACDAIDGLVARATGTASEAGEVIDSAVDRACESSIYIGLALGWRDSLPLLALVLAASAGAQHVTLASAKAEIYARGPLHLAVPGGSMRRPERAMVLVLGSAASGVLLCFSTSRALALTPLAVALTGIAVIANTSALSRFRFLAAALRAHRTTTREVSHAGH